MGGEQVSQNAFFRIFSIFGKYWMIFKYPDIHNLFSVCVHTVCECQSVYGLLMAQSMMPLSISNHSEKLHCEN